MSVQQANVLVEFYEGIIEKALRRVLDERHALFPATDPELAGQIARINAKPNITVLEAALLLNCSDSHLYAKIKAAKRKTTGYPIPFLDLDGVYVFPRERLIEWAESEKERKTLKLEKGGA
ncbi:MAG: helix-turn-helix domain-containing protein [Acidobacteria bacterium]|nr:helix-turn-helix domain-containing protein [Acidobacteriota bacterium]